MLKIPEIEKCDEIILQVENALIKTGDTPDHKQAVLMMGCYRTLKRGYSI